MAQHVVSHFAALYSYLIYMPVHMYLGAQMSGKVSPKSYQRLLCSGGIGEIFFLVFSVYSLFGVNVFIKRMHYVDHQRKQQGQSHLLNKMENTRGWVLPQCPQMEAVPTPSLAFLWSQACSSPRQGASLCTPPPCSALSLFFLLTLDTLDILSSTFHFPPPFPRP